MDTQDGDAMTHDAPNVLPLSAEEIERCARTIAQFHGSAYTFGRPGEMMQTVASERGYGHFGDASTNYANNHWQKYKVAAEQVVATISTLSARVEAAELEAQQLDDEAQHALDLAYVDKGANNRVLWKDRATAAERLVGEMREALRSVAIKRVPDPMDAGADYICQLCHASASGPAAVKHAPTCILSPAALEGRKEAG